MTDIASLGIRVTTQGIQQANRELGTLSTQADKAEAKAVKLGKAWGIALGAAGAAVIVSGAKAIIHATIEAEQVQARLENRVRALGPAAASSVKEIDRLATALQNASTFDDESLKSAATSLLAFNNIKAENFERALRAATDLAADSGDDLVATTEKLGKALNNPLTAARLLRTVGIELSASQKALVKDLAETGRQSEAQAILLAELERRYGGAAQAARNTLGGAIQGLKNDFENLLEGDGNGVRGATDAINDLAETMRSPEMKQGFQQIVDGFFSIVNAVAAAIPVIVDFNAKLGVALGFEGKGGKRRANIGDFFVGTKDGLAALANGDFDAVRRAQVRQTAGFFGTLGFGDPKRAELPDFSGVKGSSRSTADLFSGVRGSFSGDREEEGGSGGSGVGGGRSGSRARLPELPSFAGDSADDLRRLVEEEENARQAYLDLAATLSGPLAIAEREHTKNVEEINALAGKSAEAAQGKDALLAKEAERFKQETDAIKAQLDPFGQLVAEKEQELHLLQLSGAARDTAIDLMRLEGQVTAEQTKQLQELNEEYARQADRVGDQREAMDSLRGESKNFLEDVRKGVDVWDAFGNAVERVFDKLVSLAEENFIDQIFGRMGESGGGSWGDAIGNFFSSLTGGSGSSGGGTTTDGWFGFWKNGGAFANGVPVEYFARGDVFDRPTAFNTGRGMGVLGEAGPEAILPLHRGPDGKLGVRMEVSAADRATASGDINQSNTYYVMGSMDRRAREEQRSIQSRNMNRAARRNG